MGVKDIIPGMKVSVFAAEDRSAKEYKAEVVEVNGQHIRLGTISCGGEVLDTKDKHKKYNLHVIVQNALYIWKGVAIVPVRSGDRMVNAIDIQDNPEVVNRRKYPRLPITNACRVTLKDRNIVCDAKMIDISANGFAFSTYAKEFKETRGKEVSIAVSNFPLLEGKTLDGVIIRVSDHSGELLIGGRMYEDSRTIRDYVNEKMK